VKLFLQFGKNKWKKRKRERERERDVLYLERDYFYKVKYNR
jgi:hypothetical protein